MIKTMTVKELLGKMPDLNFDSDEETLRVTISGVASLHRAKKNDLTFSKSDTIPSGSGRIIFSKKRPEKSSDYFICIDNPRLGFVNALSVLTKERDWSVHESAFIGKSTKIGSPHSIARNCYLGEGFIAGERFRVGMGSCCYGHSEAGNNVTIGEYCIIGSEGFGYERNLEGELEHFPHIGGVRIEDNVTLGPSVIIARGALDDTVIGEGTKIDGFVYVAHNVVIGKHCSIAGPSAFGGSTRIGDNTTIATAVFTRNGLTIGQRCLLGLGAVITKDVPDETTVLGNPATDILSFSKQKAALKNLMG